MRYLHGMVRVKDIEASLAFYCGLLGLIEVRRKDVAGGRYTLVFLRTPEDAGKEYAPEIELTWNWDAEDYGSARNFGHFAFSVPDLYAICAKLSVAGIVINRPPRDGHMAFVRSPDNISIELLQEGEALPPQEPWTHMPNSGSW